MTLDEGQVAQAIAWLKNLLYYWGNFHYDPDVDTCCSVLFVIGPSDTSSSFQGRVNL